MHDIHSDIDESDLKQVLLKKIREHQASHRPVWGLHNGQWCLTQAGDSIVEAEKRAKRELDSERTFRGAILDLINEPICGYNHIRDIFDAQWRAAFRSRVVQMPPTEGASYPSVLYALYELKRGICSEGQVKNLDAAIQVMKNKMGDNQKQWDQFVKRLRDDKQGHFTQQPELLALAGFANVFGNESIEIPSVLPNGKRPEFFVSGSDKQSRFAVECVCVNWSADDQFINQELLVHDVYYQMTKTNDEVIRLRNSIVKKIKKDQANEKTVLICSIRTPNIESKAARDAADQILKNSTELKLDTAKLPIGIGIVSSREFVDYVENPNLKSGSLGFDQSKIRKALECGFPPS